MSGAERWQRLRAIFDEVVQLPLGDRGARLAALTADDAELRAELESLLAAEHSAGNRFENPPTLPEGWDDDLIGPRVGPGSHIGSYRVIREIGRGGMGAVYEAIRDDAGFEKRVAIKMVARGRGTDVILRRFRYERQILARLEHKNIAALVDGGVTEDGQPYFAMEYVEGERIDRYAEGRRLDVAARLQLMRQVCAAVHYAHQNLVVHRDLKPSNILVGPDGTVKLLDFGIAKIIDPLTSDDGLTETGMLPMTTSYASPEQLRGEAVTTATDVYSLGVVLYELLTGQPPFAVHNLPVLEARQRTLEEQPLPPSLVSVGERSAALALPRAMPSEVDHVVMMALRKEPVRRYASVEKLSEDLARLMAGLPIHAQPDSLGYRARKFVSRNRTGVAAVLVGFLTLAGGLATSLWQARRARVEGARAEAVSDFLQTLLLSSSPGVSVGDSRSSQRTVKDVLDLASARLEKEDLSTQPGVKATLQYIIGSSYLSQGQYDLAGNNLRAALDAQRRLYGEGSPQLLPTLVALAQLSLSSADYASAEQTYQQRLAILRTEESRGRVTADVLAGALHDFAVLRRARGHSGEAEVLLRESLALAPKLPAESRTNIGVTESVLALTLLDQGKFDEAATTARALVSRFRQGAPVSSELCGGLTLLGSALMELGQLSESESGLREAETLYRQLFDSNFVAIYDNVRLQAQVLYAAGRLGEAEVRIDETLQKYRRYVRPEYISYATALTIKGLILNRTGRSEEAEGIVREALGLRTANLPAGHFMTALTQGALGEILVTRRRFTEAEPFLLESHESLKRSQSIPNQRTQLARDRLVSLYAAWGKPERLATLR